MIAENVNPFPGAIYYLSSRGNAAESVFHGPKPFTTSSFQHAGHALVRRKCRYRRLAVVL